MAESLGAVLASSELTIFFTLLSDSMWWEFLKHAEGVTIFAPHDAAFAALSPETQTDLLANTEHRTLVLANHLVRDRLVAADLMESDSVVALNGRSYAIDSALGLRINGAYLVQADRLFDQGVLHIIDTVLVS